MPRRVPFLLCALAAALVPLAAQAPSQKAPGQQPQPPIFRTEANFVRVDVFPTRDGAPVKDLSAGDFQVFEDNVPQTIDSFEFVEVRGGVPAERRDPNTIAESREALRNPRARVFVLFLDVPHVSVHGAWTAREPLVRLIDRVLAPDDLIGIMTPRMAATDIVFARKTEVVAAGLRDRWPWGERFTLARDERENMYEGCYPWIQTTEVVREMTARRRERTTLDSLSELVRWLRNERDERKAILTISEGWALFRPNPDLARPRVIDPQQGITEPIPGPEPMGVGPDGRLRVGNTNGTHPGASTECDRDRLYLSQIDDDGYFRDIIDEANRANASFYTVDPRGLPVFDAPIGPDPPPPLSIDQRNLERRIDTLRILASNTDGLAVVNSNDLEKGLRRMADDLTSYYLLGYYSTNTKLDGRFRSITVKVKSPGVNVRARKGYKAATEEEIAKARPAAPVEIPEHVAAARTALDSLARIRPSTPLKVRATVGAAGTMIWIAGELDAPPVSATHANIEIVDTTARGMATLAAGQRSFIVPVPLNTPLTRPVDIRVRIAQAEGVPLTDMLRVEPSRGLPHPLLFRRGPVTGNRLEPAGDPVFSRTVRARFELPSGPDIQLTACRILDRNGTALEVPVTLTERTDPGGQRWSAAEVTLAPLGPGDYLMELTGAAGGRSQKLLTAFRVTR